MKKIMMTSLITIGVLLLLVIAFLGFSKILPIGLNMHKAIYQKSGIAIEEFDVVSYYKNEKPVKGFGAYPYNWNGATWLFSSEENLKSFKSSPERYVPKYGGYCTKAVRSGFAAPANPEIWTIVDDQLFFFSSNKVKDDFLKESDKHIKACNKKWTVK
jgi:YHS domain-containing protein